MVKSPRLSFKGYKISEALYRNKDAIKAIVAIIAGANFLVGLEWKVFLVSLGTAIIGLGVKILMDAIDFYFTEVEL